MTDVDLLLAPRRPKPMRKPVFDPAPFRSLFRAFRFLRVASAEALGHFFFERAFPKQCQRNDARMVATLVDEGYLAKLRLPHARVGYHLTRASLATFADAGIRVAETLRRPPTAEIGSYLWLQSNLRAEHVRLGFQIGRGPMAAYALRRFLLGAPGVVDRHVIEGLLADPLLNPPMCDGCLRCGFRAAHKARIESCPACGAGTRSIPLAAKFTCAACDVVAGIPGPHGACDSLMDESDCLPVDVAWRKVEGRYDARLLFVEHPTPTLAAQLRELPLTHVGAPRLPIVLRSTDPDSRYDRKSHLWAAKGPRHQQLERAFADAGDEDLPFFETATVIDVLSDLQLHIMRSGAPAPAWECAAPWTDGRGKYADRNKQQQPQHEHEQERERERERRVELRTDDARRIDFAALRKQAADAERVRERDARPRIDAPVRVPKREPPAVARDTDRGGGGRRR